LRHIPVILGLSLLSACLAPKNSIREVQANWVRGEDGAYSYSDDRIQIRFKPTGRSQFAWHFKNLRRHVASLDHRQMLLLDTRDGVTKPFTIWAEPYRQDQQVPEVRLNPGVFVELVYPVRFRSRLVPFRPFEKRVFSVLVSWDDRQIRYDLEFMPEEEGQP